MISQKTCINDTNKAITRGLCLRCYHAQPERITKRYQWLLAHPKEASQAHKKWYATHPMTPEQKAAKSKYNRQYYRRRQKAGEQSGNTTQGESGSVD